MSQRDLNLRRLFTVFGATGQQGGALIKYLLNHPEFSKVYKIRGITRDSTKQAAVALKKYGVEVVEADMDDPSSLHRAVKDSYAIFTVTNHWEKASAAIEIAQGKAQADAAVAAGASLLIWSSLPRTGVGHFDSKADVEDYIRTLPIKSAFYMPGWFMQNFLVIMKPKLTSDGTYVMAKPWPGATASSLIPLVDIEDTGKYIFPFLANPEKYNHSRFIASTAFYTPGEICEAWTSVTGTTVKFDEIYDGVSSSNLTPEQKEALGKSNAAKWSSYYGPGGKEGLEWTLKQMEEQPTTWENFVRTHQPWFNKN